jgi:hypothetical protein
VVRDYPLSRREADSYADKYCLRELLMLGSEVTVAYDGKHLTFARGSSEPKPKLDAVDRSQLLVHVIAHRRKTRGLVRTTRQAERVDSCFSK